MNRLVIIGNGFDLAHGLMTSYKDFIHWYWKQRIEKLANEQLNESDDGLCVLKKQIGPTWGYILSQTFARGKPAESILEYMLEQRWCTMFQYPLLERISKGLETKTWAGIEQDYYDLLKEYALSGSYGETQSAEKIEALNQQLAILQTKLVEYLKEVEQHDVMPIEEIADAIYAPIEVNDIAVTEQHSLGDHADFWIKQGAESLKIRQELFGISDDENDAIIDTDGNPIDLTFDNVGIPIVYRLPSKIMLLNFNYTSTPEKYFRKGVATLNYIHGKLDAQKYVIFGYGDEIDEDFKKLKAHKNSACLKNVKAYHYLEASNYREVLSFIEAEPFQVLIMGHSCGNSDRTLLHTIFEHNNCVSIKPYYYQKIDGSDDYISMAQSISRSFNDMELMRARVVNKTQCEPLVK